ncbi:DNA-binding NarL/FixJ family response regulator [Chryseobacterium bernardetii]|jgi:DNA-binding NarL/FixJ family response regulator|uniref:LuxR family two component transcriptional regulator n=3 Tax=Chryseobacterium TaxID=59732 RepID=A0A543EL79_9FLAO|nr:MULTISPECIES: response regulator transcription factor [Chryseobacterium]MDR6372354.1 DNA-binding NarL/FixJ family response regulator [Chryseobacterium vietnamense]MDR6442262.1 DNA-binding NarL/FixJ family response regulator [Chryseobacterium bernardetii]MDR6458734.1 DNA-binding NarL/FixJ family response regulator [Chryseobacterium vietnamense]MDR6489914.1 DNA-binding NarL/FixJ family response regulator [Chryseobacterium vietnamense]TQM22312.1 LuxR family two component transcriptional regula
MGLKVNIRIVVADDHGIVRMGLIQTIKRFRPDAIISEVEDYKSLYKLILNEEFDLAIMDVNMPNGTVQEAIDYIKIHQPALKTLIFSSQDEELYGMRYLKMGAGGYLSKLSSTEVIETALTAMLTKGRYISDNIKEAIFLESLNGTPKSSPFEALSDRELQIANKLAEGLPLKEISNQLNLHSSTISTYKIRLFEKLKIRSIPELVEILRLYNQ